MANSHFENSRVLDPLIMTALSVGDAAAVAEHKEWLQATGCSPNTINDRIRLLVRLNSWLLAQPKPTTLGEATADDLATWQRSISRLATETIATYVGHARGYFRWLAKYKHRADASALLVRPRVPRHLPRPISDLALRDALRMAEGPVLISLLLMAFCGMRVGEVAKLQRHDIRDLDTPPIVFIHGKGGKHRIVPMAHDLGPELRRIGIPLRGPVVVSPRGGPYTPTRLSSVVNEYLHDHGVEDTAHALRHWYGTNIYRMAGRDLRLVQELLGHSSAGTTAGYAAYDPQQATVVAAALDERMSDLLHGGRRLRVVAAP